MPGRIMGIDYGDARVGVSVSDLLMLTAQGVKTIPNRGEEKLMAELVPLLEMYQPEEIVVGMPKNMDGSLGARAEKTQEFVGALSNHYQGKIVLWDERLTTVSAIQILNTTDTRGKNRKKTIDTVAACLILENYMAAQKNKTEK
jgi:putative Holliday junction resolvase